MKVGAMIAGLVAAIAAGGVTYWMITGEASSSVVTESDGISPSPTGPHPRAVIAESTHDFGRMVLGGKDRHTFVIKNEGAAPLRLGEPEMTCQCTVAKQAPGTIAPGETGEIMLEWEPTSATDTFDKGARIQTNDPEQPLITLAITGIVDRAIVVQPEGVWQVGTVSADDEIRVSGYVYSRILDDFQVESWTSESDHLRAEISPVTKDELTEREALAGNEVVATLDRSIPVGKFSEKLTLTTNAPGKANKELSITIEGTRLGPIQILPMPGARWNSSAMAIDLGRFPTNEGAESTVLLFVNGMPKDKRFQFTSVESDVEGISLELAPMETESTGGPQRFKLTFEAAAGLDAQTRRSKESAHVTVETNHSEAKEIKFYVQFVATPS